MGTNIKTHKIEVAVVLACLLIPMLAGFCDASVTNSAPSVGYSFPNPLVDTSFVQPPNDLHLSVNNASKDPVMDNPTFFRYIDGALYVRYNTTGGSLYIQNSEKEANTVRLVIDTTTVDEKHIYQINVIFSVINKPGQYYQESLDLYPYQIKMRPSYWLGEGSQQVESRIMSYSVSYMDSLDIVISVRNGKVICDIDGQEFIHNTDYKILKDLAISNISISSNQLIWDNPSHIHLKKLQIGQDTNVQYHDRLHKTITPWGKDFSVSMQLHADHANPSELALLKHLADTYGVLGEFAAWVYNSDTSKQYGIASSQAYLEACRALQASNWTIGTHALSDSSINRTRMLAALAIFEQDLGPLKSWVDHGEVQQDMISNGDNVSSEYYIADYLIKNNVQIWVDQPANSHSEYDDLNYGGSYYTNSSFPGMDLSRTSNSGILRLFNEWNSNSSHPVDESDFDLRLESYAAEKAVLVWHDYLFRLVYVRDGGVSYSYINLSSMGYQYTLIPLSDRDIYGANEHPNGTWRLLPAVEYLFASMKDTYDVWFATPQEIYQRSRLVQSTDVSETSSAVSITNHNTRAVDGFTLFMKGKPSFYLKLGNTSYYPTLHAGSWSFVIDSLPASFTLKLIKVDMPDTSSLDLGAILEFTPYLFLLAVIVVIEVSYLTWMKKKRLMESGSEKVIKRRKD